MKRTLLLDWGSCDGGNNGWTSPPVAPSPTPPWARPTVVPQTNTVTGDTTLSLGYMTNYLVQSTAKALVNGVVPPYYVTLPNGNFLGQVMKISIPTTSIATTANFLLLGTFAGGWKSIAFNNQAFNCVLEWDGSGWQMVAGNAQLSMAEQ